MIYLFYEKVKIMSEQSLNFIVMIEIKKDFTDSVYKIIGDFVEAIKHEDGCLNCECLQPVKNKNLFLCQESWVSIEKATEQITKLHVDYLSAVTSGDFFNQNVEVSTWLMVSDNEPFFNQNDENFSFLIERKAKKGKEKDIRLFFEKIIDISMIETDCLSYCLYTNSLGQDDRFLLIGTWKNKAAWEEHHNAEYLQNFIFREQLSLIVDKKPLLQEVKKIL